jgi:integrase
LSKLTGMARTPLKQRRAEVAQRRRVRVGGDLFSQPEWAQYLAELDELFAAYAAWRRERYEEMRVTQQRITRADLPWRTSSEQVYWDIWVAFTGRLVAHMRRLEDVDRAYLAAYLVHLAQGTGPKKNLAEDGRLQPRYARRVLSLIDRLSRYDAERRAIPANPAVSELLKDPEQEVLREANRRENDELPAFLDAGDRERVKDLLMLPVGSPAADAPATWRELRDNAAVAVQLGAGLAPGEVRALRLQDVDGERRSGYGLRVRASGNRHQRSNTLAAWAGGALAAWLKAARAEGGRQLRLRVLHRRRDPVVEEQGDAGDRRSAGARKSKAQLRCLPTAPFVRGVGTPGRRVVGRHRGCAGDL